MTRDELKTAFEFIENTLDEIYSDVVFLDVVQDTTRNFPAFQKRALDNICILAYFAHDTINRFDSKEKLK